jgi:chemotaxis protein histidine kinase CheA
MARLLRSFLIVEAAGQRIALPWSAVERIHASTDELTWAAEPGENRVHPIAALFERPVESGAMDIGALVQDVADTKTGGRPLAVIRSGAGAVVIGFDRIVWRENARLTSLPPRLCPVEEVLGGIVAPDGSVTLVLNPGAVVRRLRGSAPAAVAAESAAAKEAQG